MADHETKLKLGRKLKVGDASTASDNQVSVLFRCDAQGNDRHVSITIESDQMGAEDVRALLDLLAQRGIFTSSNSKTWVSQPQASETKWGPVHTWKGTDIVAMSKGGM